MPYKDLGGHSPAQKYTAQPGIFRRCDGRRPSITDEGARVGIRSLRSCTWFGGSGMQCDCRSQVAGSEYALTSGNLDEHGRASLLGATEEPGHARVGGATR
jgi:hypothetical protein